MISILYIILYGRVGGVSRGGCAYPDIQITGRLYHFFWKLPNFSFRQFFWNSCYNLYLHQYQNPTKYQKWRGLLKTFGVFKHCVFKSVQKCSIIIFECFGKMNPALCINLIEFATHVPGGMCCATVGYSVWYLVHFIEFMKGCCQKYIST